MHLFARFASLLLAVDLIAAAPINVDDLLRFVLNEIEEQTDDGELAHNIQEFRPNRAVSSSELQWLTTAGAGAKTIRTLKTFAKHESGPTPSSDTIVKYTEPLSFEDGRQLWHRAQAYVQVYTAALVDFTCTVDINPAKKELTQSRPVADTTFVVSTWTSWQPSEHLSQEVSYYKGREYHSSALSLGRSRRLIPGNAWTTGEFAQALRITFSNSSKAKFRWDHWEANANRQLAVYSYSVAKENSQFLISTQQFRSGTWQNVSLIAGYHGFVWIDPESGGIYQLIANTTDLPPDYAIRQGHTILTYGPVAIAGVRHLLLTGSTSYIGTAEYQSLFRKTFHRYRKFEAQSRILP